MTVPVPVGAGGVDRDQGCPLCHAPPDEMCTTASGKVRNDHTARIRAALSSRPVQPEQGRKEKA